HRRRGDPRRSRRCHSDYSPDRADGAIPMTDHPAADSGRSSTARDVIVRAEVLRRLPSTRSDLADELDRGLALARDGDPDAARVLTAAVDAVDNFRHILPVDEGFALSLYVRGLLDSAYWALESPST